MRRAAHLAVLACLALVGGCEPAEMGLAKSGGPCDASAAQFAVGQAADSNLAARAKKSANANGTRWLKSGEVFFQEDANRLTLEVDSGNQVVSARCG